MSDARETELQIRLTVGEKARLKAYAKRHGTTVASLIRSTVSRYLDAEERLEAFADAGRIRAEQTIRGIQDDLGRSITNIVGTVESPR